MGRPRKVGEMRQKEVKQAKGVSMQCESWHDFLSSCPQKHEKTELQSTLL